jgi:hypothetical protein
LSSGHPALSGVDPLRLPLIYGLAVDPVFAILLFFQFAALLAFFALFATIGHDALLSQCKRELWRLKVVGKLAAPPLHF